MHNAKCNKCKTRQLRAATEVTGNDADIKREFERIERNQSVLDLRLADITNLVDMLEATDYLKAKQTKTPSAETDGV